MANHRCLEKVHFFKANLSDLDSIKDLVQDIVTKVLFIIQSMILLYLPILNRLVSLISWSIMQELLVKLVHLIRTLTKTLKGNISKLALYIC
jgi:hypothetical protein